MAKDEKKTKDPLAAVAVGFSAAAGLDDNFEPAHTKPSAAETAAPPEEPVMAPPGAAVPVTKAPSFEVLRDVTLSWGPAFIKLRAGDVISEDGYGDGAIEKMALAGVALKQVEG